MKFSTLLAIALPVSFLISSCDRDNPTEPGSSADQVSVHPRLKASSPLPGSRIELRLRRKGSHDIVVDTLYVSGSTLKLGTVANGDSFTVGARGYDSIDGVRKYLWSGSVATLAQGGRNAIQLVDVPVDSASSPTMVGIATDPTTIVIPKGSWYSTDGSDPRLMTPGKAWKSDSVVAAKDGTIRIAGMKVLASGDTLWSPVVTLAYGTSTTNDSLVGAWWEDDTTTSGVRSIHLDSLDADGNFKRIPYDTASLLPIPGGVVQKGTWRARDGVLRWSFEMDPSPWLIDLGRNASGYVLQFRERPLRGLLSRTTPMASKLTDTTGTDTTVVDTTHRTLRDSLVGEWWEDYRDTKGSRIVYLDTFNMDGTFSASILDSATLRRTHISSGTWSVVNDSLKLLYTGGFETDVAAVTRLTGEFKLAYVGSGTSTLSKTQPVFGTPAARTLLAVYWEDDTTSSGIRGIFLDSIYSDSTFARIEHDTNTLSSGTATSGKWRSGGGAFVLELGPTTGDTIRLDAAKATVSGGAIRGKLGTTKPPASKSASPLAGVWWEVYDGWSVYYCDTVKQDGSYSAVEYDTATGKPTGTSFSGTWSLDETDSTITFRVSESSFDRASISAIAEGYKLVYTTGSTSTLSKTQPTPSTSGPADTAWSLASRKSLAGTWWSSTSVVTSRDDTIPVAVRHVFDADGSGAGRKTVFVTWLDSLSDAAITYDATEDLLKVAKGDSLLVSKFATNADMDTLRFLDGSNRSWTRTRPILCDSTMVGTWISSTDSLLLEASSNVEWWSSGIKYRYTWSTLSGWIFYYLDNEAEPTYRYRYTPGSKSAVFYELDFTKKDP